MSTWAASGDDDAELVAAEPRQRVGLADLAAHQLRHLLQQQVAGVVAGAVVERLKAVDVEPHEPELDPDPLRARDLLAQLGVELATVRQAR